MNINSNELDYGIKRIEVFGKMNDKNEKDFLDEKKLKDLEYFSKASIVKMESIAASRIVLLCKYLKINRI